MSRRDRGDRRDCVRLGKLQKRKLSVNEKGTLLIPSASNYVGLSSLRFFIRTRRKRRERDTTKQASARLALRDCPIRRRPLVSSVVLSSRGFFVVSSFRIPYLATMSSVLPFRGTDLRLHQVRVSRGTVLQLHVISFLA